MTLLIWIFYRIIKCRSYSLVFQMIKLWRFVVMDYLRKKQKFQVSIKSKFSKCCHYTLKSIILLDSRYQTQNDKVAMGYPLGPKLVKKFFGFFSIVCYLACPWQTLSYCWGDSFIHPILLINFNFQPEGHWEPRN